MLIASDRAPVSEYDPFGSDDFEQFVKKTMRDYYAPGLSIAIVCKDRTYAKGYGFANLERGESYTPDTLFYGASTTKSFLSALVSKLIYSEQNDQSLKIPVGQKITWTTRISEILPDEFILQDEYATKHVTILDALSHRTGLPGHDMIWFNNNLSLEETVRSLRHVAMHHELRETWEYTNVMYTAVARVLEKVTGRSVNTLLHEWLLKPLGMDATAYSIGCGRDLAADPNNDNNIARGYLFDEARDMQCVVPWEEYPSADGAGGIVSTAMDYAKWIRAFLPSSATNRTTLDPRIVDFMSQSHMVMPPGSRTNISDQGAYGIGLRTGIFQGYKVIEHTGGDPGHMTLMRWIPQLEWGMVVSTNSYDFAHLVVATRLTDDFFQVPLAERWDIETWLAEFKKRNQKDAEQASSDLKAQIKRSLEPEFALGDYEGEYQHQAYGTLKISTKLPSGRSELGLPESSIRLYMTPAHESCAGVWFIINHINGEHWLARCMLYISKWSTDTLMNLHFETGIDGLVSGIKLQAESAIDELAWFKKVG